MSDKGTNKVTARTNGDKTSTFDYIGVITQHREEKWGNEEADYK